MKGYGFKVVSDLHVVHPCDVELPESVNGLLLLLGDLTQNGDVGQLFTVKDALTERRQGAWAAVPGNHDVRCDAWSHVFGNKVPVFRYRDRLFHGLDSSTGTVPRHQVKSVRRKEPDVVFLHHQVYSDLPLEGGFYRVGNHEELREVFEEAEVDLVLQGHRHQQNRCSLNGVDYATFTSSP